MCKNASSCCWIVSFYGWHSPWPSTSRSPIRFDRAGRQSCAHAWSTAFLTAVVHDDGTDATPTLSDCQWCHQCHLKPQCASASTRRETARRKNHTTLRENLIIFISDFSLLAFAVTSHAVTRKLNLALHLLSFLLLPKLS